MHELAIAQSLVMEACRVAAENRAPKVDAVWVQVGPLSGVEPPLLERAFTVARAETAAHEASLTIETGSIEVRCSNCDAETHAGPNKIVCGACGAWQVQIIAGDELVLHRVELSGIHEEHDEPCATPAAAR
jgi:hydrogenase nickel incorporation protein HypA/HybF